MDGLLGPPPRLYFRRNIFSSRGSDDVVALPQIARTALPKALYSLIPTGESSITTQRSSRILVLDQ